MLDNLRLFPMHIPCARGLLRAKPTDARCRRLEVLTISRLEIADCFLVLVGVEAFNQPFLDCKGVEDRREPDMPERAKRRLLAHGPRLHLVEILADACRNETSAELMKLGQSHQRSTI